ncbi:MAG: protein kinase [Chloroflexi bacterium]|nr:protein kinase [Chloroflexota bacterium]
MSIAPGEQLGVYRVIEPLGQGGMATVYKAYHPALDRYVAIKILHPAFKEDKNFIARFEREARIVAKLDHPNIVPVFDYAQHDGMPYLVMRYVEGKTLKAILRETNAALPVERVLAFIRPVAEGLTYAHIQGVLHRDIKPSNIMRANDGHIYLTDFGLARIAQSGESTMSQDMVIGTPQYISPEQAQGAPVSERTDIYSLGVVLFEMLTGRVPFTADTPYAVIHDHIYTALPMPTAINPALAPEIERVLLKALAKDPAARYTSAGDLFVALETCARVSPAPTTLTPPPQPVAPLIVTPQAQPVAPSSVARTPPPPEPVAPQSARRFSAITCAILAVIALALLAGCGVLAFSRRDDIARALRLSPAGQTETIRSARDRVNANPNDPIAHIRLAEALASANQFDAAYAEYDQAIALNPKQPEAYLRAGAQAERANDLDHALKYYDAGHQIAPDDQTLLLNIGDVYMKQKRYEDARAVFEKALRFDSGNAQAVFRMGEYYRATGRLAEALREYTRAVAMDPNLPEAHYGLGMLALQRGATDEARRQFQMVVTNPKSPADLKDQAQQQLRALDKK